MARIVTVYGKRLSKYDREYGALTPIDMSYIRWFKISEALARRGHQVDIATNEFKLLPRKATIIMNQNLRRISLLKVRWQDYHVVKTNFHTGFHTLEFYGGRRHPFIISHLGSVVGPKDMEGVYFYGRTRKRLYLLQKRIDKTSKYIILLTNPAKELWENCFGPRNNIFITPEATDAEIPPPQHNPYPKKGKLVCLFAGNIYEKENQLEANITLSDKLNKLGEVLSSYGIQLYMIGPGDVSRLNKKYVNYLGVVPYDKSWDYLYFADVGIVIALGKFLNINESSKIYHYLRVGLPVVCESGFPNEDIITEARLGFTVENGNLELMAQKIKEAAGKDWNRDYAIKYILENHTWDKRVEVYDKIIKESFN